MKVVEVGNKVYLAASFEDDKLVDAMQVGNTEEVSQREFIEYGKKSRLNTLQTRNVKNSETSDRDLNPVEIGFKTNEEAAAKQAEETAMAYLVNRRVDELMGKR